ncbi:MAG: patatin-like phospholipase family protein, partial [Desulfuromonadales bacterium]|nr:patatin-like phospholipase family protein [Desulfuromonadales bacterium]
MSDNKTTVSLVLGSGGARGLAHIGVIRWLEDNDYRIASVSGASIGALIGGIYAAGQLDTYEKWVRAIRKIDMVSLVDLSLFRGGLVKGEKIISTLRDLIGDMRIEDLPMPFTAVATDIAREKEVWLSRGPLFDAIRASISMPLVFTPLRINGIHLIDGGVLNPVPIAPTFDDQTDLTIAVNLGAAPQPGVELPPEPPAVNGAPLHEKILNFIADLASDDDMSTDGDSDMFDVVNQSIDAMQGTIARQKLAAYPPDVLIEIPRNVCGTFDYDRAAALIT